MVFLHCGWPKTGTSSLQAALVKHRQLLVAGGLVYPTAWRTDRDPAHHGLTDLLGRDLGYRDLLAELRRSLATSGGGHALLSVESVSIWLLRDWKCEALLRLLRAIQEIAPVTCLWTLRRFDEMVHSGCVHGLFARDQTRSPVELMRGLRQDRLLSNICRIEDAVEGRVFCARYDPAGTHNEELLQALDLPDRVQKALSVELTTSPRLNPGRTRKQLALWQTPALSPQGRELHSTGTPCAGRSGSKASVSLNGPCELAGPDVRLELHEAALQTARESGFEPYLRFFEDETLGEIPQPVDIDASTITDQDLAALVMHLSKLPEQGRLVGGAP